MKDLCPGVEATETVLRQEITGATPIEVEWQNTADSVIVTCPFLIYKYLCNRPFSDDSLPANPSRSSTRITCRYFMQRSGTRWQRNGKDVGTVK
jgi:hypothetical protein